MIRAFNCAAILVVLSIFLVSWANASDLSAEYLQGKWVIDEQNCSSSDSEYMQFNQNGTFTGTRSGDAELVGFWKLDKGIIKLHMVTSLAFFNDINKDLTEFENIYNYFTGNLIIFNIQDNNFEMFGSIGNEIERTSAVRCK
jgi:hypothetical protein